MPRKSNPRLIQLRDEFTLLRSGTKSLEAKTAAEHRDFTEDERATFDAACTRMEAIEKDVEETLKRDKRFDAVAEVTAGLVEPESSPARTNPRSGLTRSDITYDPARAGMPIQRMAQAEVAELGEYAKVLGRAKVDTLLGKMDDETLQRVVAHGVSGDGVAPVTIEGDLIKFVDSNRYAVNACRLLPMPDNHAPTFKRPRATQLTTDAVQTNEGDVLSSQRLQLTGDTVTKKTYGGVLALSEQEIDWTDPAMLGLAIQDLAQQYAIATDTVLTAAITTAAALNDATETVLAASLPSAANFTAAITAAAGVAYAASKMLPDTLFIDTNWWTRIIGVVDTTGRPLFPYAGAMNASGVAGAGVTSFSGYNVFGLNVVVDPNFTADTMLVAVSQLCEFYEQNKGLLTINAPSTLEVQYAYRGYAAANVYSQGIGLIEAV